MADELKAGSHTINDEKARALPLKVHTLSVSFSTAKSIHISGEGDMSNPQEKRAGDFANGATISVSGGFIRVNGGSAILKLEEVKVEGATTPTPSAAPSTSTRESK